MIGPDAIFTDATYYTLAADGASVEALAVSDGKIIAAGKAADIAGLCTPNTQVYRLGGATVLPGFVDSHAHIDQEYIWSYDENAFVGAGTREQVLGAIGQHVREQKGQLASGWAVVPGESVPESLWPTRDELDRVEPHVPVIACMGARTFVLNSAALDACRIDRGTAAPPGGTFTRDVTGELDGRVRQRAIETVIENSPFGRDDIVDASLRKGIGRLACVGITSTQPILRGVSPMRSYQRLAAAGALPARVGVLIRAWEAECDLPSLLKSGIQPGFGSDWISIEGAKVSIDGHVAARGAALSQDYSDAPGQRGELRISPAELTDFVVSAHVHGLRCAVHAKGDRSLDMALDAFEQAYTACPRALRHRLEHVGNVRPSDQSMARMARLGLTAVVNPTFLDAEGPYLHQRLGAKRAQSPVCVADLRAAGVSVIAASDFSGVVQADDPAPLNGIATLVTRRTRDGGTYGPEQAIDVWDAVRCYTTGPAELAYYASLRGRLLPGYLADMAVLNGDPFACAPESIRGIEVLSTIVGGQVTHGENFGVTGR
jgi:predicted amidohydrolase YtcJ